MTKRDDDILREVGMTLLNKYGDNTFFPEFGKPTEAVKLIISITEQKTLSKVGEIIDNWYNELSYGSLIGVSSNQLAEWKVLGYNNLDILKDKIKKEISTEKGK